jgi:2-iminobutanoate/2-iminopropanoate deaminase
MIGGSHLSEEIRTTNAPEAVGPYSQAVEAGGFVFLSGQLGIDPASGQIEAPDAAGQAKQALVNLRAVLEAAGLSMLDVVKTTIYLTDISDFAAVNKVYASFFTGGTFPARATVQVGALPKEGKVEIDAIAVCD